VRRVIPRTRMGIFTVCLILLWLLKSLFVALAGRQALPAGLLFFLDSLTLLLALPALYYAWVLSAALRRRLLWRIRRRLILAHTFIGLIPVLLVIVILWISALLFYYQYTYYLIVNQIGIHLGQLHAFNLSLASGLQQAAAGWPGGRGDPDALLGQDSRYLLGAYPSAAVILHVTDTATGRRQTFGAGKVRPERLREYQEPPRWIEGREYSGLVAEDLQPGLYQPDLPAADAERRARLYLRSCVAGELRPGLQFFLESSVPFDGYMLDRLKAATGQEMLLADRVPTGGLNIMLQDSSILRQNIVGSTFETEGAEGGAGRPMWSILLYPVSWATGVETESADSQVLFVELSTSKLLQNLFRSDNPVGRTILDVLRIVIGFFIVVEILSLLVGILLTRSITSAVHNLYRGTEFIRRGDFSHRIVVKSDDQLGALARSFNQMTEYIQTLVKERVQKERLERELEIAKEVQERLFPHQAPRLERLELTGLCLPARVVSGDYYDFLPFDANAVGVALGDICGKGISAALLMANLQAALRSNAANFVHGTGDGGGARAGSQVSRVVAALNRHIVHYTSTNKFASLFYGVFEEGGLSLTYCNAGHNPPLFLGRDGWRRLETGGTVVGIFAEADYEQETIRLAPGDLLLAYTDGILECVNEYGEEFGEARLIRLVQEHRQLPASEIQKVVVEEVLKWTFEEERDDDMTLIIGKVR
jgi:sigma-B regulation protein RsbU (phosphoserine phosphatase)